MGRRGHSVMLIVVVVVFVPFFVQRREGPRLLALPHPFGRLVRQRLLPVLLLQCFRLRHTLRPAPDLLLVLRRPLGAVARLRVDPPTQVLHVASLRLPLLVGPPTQPAHLLLQANHLALQMLDVGALCQTLDVPSQFVDFLGVGRPSTTTTLACILTRREPPTTGAAVRARVDGPVPRPSLRLLLRLPLTTPVSRHAPLVGGGRQRVEVSEHQRRVRHRGEVVRRRNLHLVQLQGLLGRHQRLRLHVPPERPDGLLLLRDDGVLQLLRHLVWRHVVPRHPRSHHAHVRHVHVPHAPFQHGQPRQQRRVLRQQHVLLHPRVRACAAVRAVLVPVRVHVDPAPLAADPPADSCRVRPQKRVCLGCRGSGGHGRIAGPASAATPVAAGTPLGSPPAAGRRRSRRSLRRPPWAQGARLLRLPQLGQCDRLAQRVVAVAVGFGVGAGAGRRRGRGRQLRRRRRRLRLRLRQ
eukprot:Rhum_TRINITY_DN14316_c28_g1::Rhum_TRINITY_DN14316_c28_g1_i1::g.82623::m.82623